MAQIKTGDIKEYRKKYYNTHKEHIMKSMMEKRHCDLCNCDFTKCYTQKHKRSQKHQNQLNQRASLEQSMSERMEKAFLNLLKQNFVLKLE